MKKNYKLIGIICVGLLIAIFCFIIYSVATRGINAPMSSDELDGINYKKVVKEFKDVGFTKVIIEKKKI